MKVLLSAFGCAPNEGSDKEVGWQWATRLARRGHDITVLTRVCHRASIERALALEPAGLRPRFHYLDSDAFLRCTRWFKGRIYLYYYLWQWYAYRKAQALHAAEGFDLVHHVTWVSVRQPSFMGRLGIPFYFGPVAGGERAPWALRRGYGMRQWAQDVVRDLTNAWVRLDPMMWATFRRATKIFVTSEDTMRLVPMRYRGKAAVGLAVGSEHQSDSMPEASLLEPGEDQFHILYAGRFIGWKGMHLGFRALKELLQSGVDARLTMVGRGPDAQEWRGAVRELGLDQHVNWIDWVQRDRLAAMFRMHDVFLFPSLHDSGGLAVLEALGEGLPVVCLDLGGPSVVVDSSCGVVVPVGGASRDEVISGLAAALQLLARDAQTRKRLSEGARRRIGNFTWDALIDGIYGRDVD